MDTKGKMQPPLQAFFDRHAKRNGSPAPLAVFDCDGTVIQGDIGESMFYRQIEHFAFRISPAEVWQDHPRRSELAKAYSALAATPAPLRRTHPAFDPFAAFLLTWYFDQLAAGKVAKACADIVQLFAGFTLDEVRAFAEATFIDELQSPIAQCRLGGRPLPRGVRFLQESVDLIRTLQQHGFDILAISGSNKWSVEPVFARLGVPADRVAGIDLHADNGRLSPRTRQPIPIHGGKVDVLREMDHRPAVLVASDSRNDIPLLLASTDVRVYVNSHNRKTDDFFTLGKITRDETWVVFEDPTIIPNLDR
jgi:phosphoserine phosphatase